MPLCRLKIDIFILENAGFESTGNASVLMKSLFTDYEKSTLPTCADNSIIQVKIGMALRQIIELVSILADTQRPNDAISTSISWCRTKVACRIPRICNGKLIWITKCHTRLLSIWYRRTYQTDVFCIRIIIGIKHGFPCINVCQVPREMLKTEAVGQNVNVLENDVWSLLLHKFNDLFVKIWETLWHYILSPFGR